MQPKCGKNDWFYGRVARGHAVLTASLHWAPCPTSQGNRRRTYTPCTFRGGQARLCRGPHRSLPRGRVGNRMLIAPHQKTGVASRSKLRLGVHGIPGPEAQTPCDGTLWVSLVLSALCARAIVACMYKGLFCTLGCELNVYFQVGNRSDAFHPPTSVALLVPGPGLQSHGAPEPVSTAGQGLQLVSALWTWPQGHCPAGTHQDPSPTSTSCPTCWPSHPNPCPGTPGRWTPPDNCVGFQNTYVCPREHTVKALTPRAPGCPGD